MDKSVYGAAVQWNKLPLYKSDDQVLAIDIPDIFQRDIPIAYAVQQMLNKAASVLRDFEANRVDLTKLEISAQANDDIERSPAFWRETDKPHVERLVMFAIYFRVIKETSNAR